MNLILQQYLDKVVYRLETLQKKVEAKLKCQKMPFQNFLLEMFPENLLRQSRKEKTLVMTAVRISRRVFKLHSDILQVNI